MTDAWPVFIEVKATIIVIAGAKATVIAYVGTKFVAIVAFIKANAVVVTFVDRVGLGLGHFELELTKTIITTGEDFVFIAAIKEGEVTVIAELAAPWPLSTPHAALALFVYACALREV